MAQTGYTPILIYSSSTAAQAPAAGNLTNSTLGSELAINITDGKLFYKDNANAVQVIAWKTTPTTAGGTGLTSYTAGDLLYYASGTALTKLAIGATGRWLGSSGTAPQWNAPAALTKTDDTNVTLTLGGNASTALLNAASLTLGWTGQLATSRGGTGLSSFTTNGILYATSTSALTTGSALTFDGSLVVPQSAIGTSGTVGFRANDTTNSKNIQMFRAGSGYNYLGIVGTQGVIYSIDQLTIAADTSSPIWFSTGGSLRGGWSGAGGFSVGNTTNPGASNLSVSGLIFGSGLTSSLGNYWIQARNTNGSYNTVWLENASGNDRAILICKHDQAAGATTGAQAAFLNSAGTAVGSITSSNTATAYNTSSDYRLKDNPQPLQNSGAFIDALKPKTWSWKSDGSAGVGFLAHEVQEISPGSVIGKKDETDEDGSPKYQAMEYGSAEFIANIVAELQSLRIRVAELEKKA
jgi:hypothetical protein